MKKIIMILIGAGSLYVGVADTNNNFEDLGAKVRESAESAKIRIAEAQEDGFMKTFDKVKASSVKFYQEKAAPALKEAKADAIEAKNMIVDNMSDKNKEKLDTIVDGVGNEVKEIKEKDSNEVYQSVKRNTRKAWNLAKNKFVEDQTSDTKE